MPDGDQTIVSAPETRQELIKLSPPRLPWHPELKERFDIDGAQWRALIDAIWPAAKTVDSIVNALSYCKARHLDPFKRPVHIVPVWSRTANKMIETIWPGIGELRTTAFRTGLYAGRDKPEFGPDKTMDLSGVAVTFPEYCELTVYRLDRNGQRMAYPGPRVYWLESYATAARDTQAPNEMWKKRPRGQLEKCSEAAALRAAFPEEIGNDYTDDEMRGQVVEHEPGPPPPRPTLQEYAANGFVGADGAAERKPARSRKARQPAEPAAPEPEPDPPPEDKPYSFADHLGEVHEFAGFDDAVAAYAELLTAADSVTALEAAWENGAELIAMLRGKDHASAADLLDQQYFELRAAFGKDEPEDEPEQEGAGDEGDASPTYDVAVPLTGTAQAWFQPARQKLREMTEAGRPPVDFRRYRETNATGLAALKKTMSAWYGILEKILVAGEAGLAPQS